MLEILLLFYLCKKLGALLREKGRSTVGFQIMLVAFWFLGEILGGIAGAVVSAIMDGGTPRDGFNFMIYLCALAGAALGAVVTFVIAKSLQPVFVTDRPTGGFPVVERPYEM